VPIFSAIASLVAGQAVGKLRERVRPNPYAPRLTNQQVIAAQQAGGLRPGTSGLAGSERDWYTDAQGASSIGWVQAQQDLTAHAMPPSWDAPGDPGADPTDPTVLADVKRGPVRLDLKPYGVTPSVPYVIAGRINPPLAKSPLPRDVAAARDAGAPQGIQDAFDTLYDG
jgi:hypothetical protein